MKIKGTTCSERHNMISYNNNPKTGELHITITSGIMHCCDFLNALTEMSEKVLTSRSETIFISAKQDDFKYDKLGMVYFANLLRMFTRKNKKVYVVRWLLILLNEKKDETGSKFEKIDIIETIMRDKLPIFRFEKDEDASEAVQKIVEFIHESGMCIPKDFLITTIGEIFSNAFNHSEEGTLYFMYDIEIKEAEIYLVINVTDFGKTIINNVRDYMKKKQKMDVCGMDCVKWAIQEGNTTRDSSGGYGLPTLIRYIKKVKGELLIFTGDVFYVLEGEKENIVQSKGFFYGTSISFRIHLFDTETIVAYNREQNELISISLDEL